MARYLMTQSLLSSWAYTFDCFEGCEEDAQADFLRTLRREPGEQTEAMLNGISFETGVYLAAANLPDKPNEKWINGTKAVADIIRGAQVQVKVSREIVVDGMSFLLYGILDALKAGVIYDVKFLNKSMNSADLYGKYLNSAQHPAYFYLVPSATEFQYLVSDGEDVYIERYQRNQTRGIDGIIHDFIDSITKQGLLDLYNEKWLAQ